MRQEPPSGKPSRMEQVAGALMREGREILQACDCGREPLAAGITS